MKKTILSIAFLLTLLCVASISNAQSGRLSIGFEAAQPIGDFGDAVSTGFGGSLRYEHPMGDKIGLMFTAGYMAFGGKDDGPTWNLIPVQAGAKFYFSEQQKGLYVGAEVGVHSSSVTIPGYDLGGGVVVPDEDVSDTNLSYAPEVGFHLAHIDLGLRYQIVDGDPSSLNYLGLRAAWAFGGE